MSILDIFESCASKSVKREQTEQVLTFLDVETPNWRNDRVCQIALIQTDEKGIVLDKLTHLVNPEERFDDVNMSIHGITPMDVKNAPTFPELWTDALADKVLGTKIVAHNAPFDLSTILKTLRCYEIDTPSFDYACTQKMMQAAHPHLSSYKLPAACGYYNIEVENHHDAFSDASACRELFWHIIDETGHAPTFQTYCYEGPSEIRPKNHYRVKFAAETSELQILKSLSEKVLEDEKVSTAEAYGLLFAIENLPNASNDAVIKSLKALLQETIVDGWIDEGESEKLVASLRKITDPVAQFSDSEHDIVFAEKCFCLSGDFDHGSKSQIGSMIEAKGGTILKSVTKKCDYLIVGGQGNEAWSMGNYGNKVKKALDWQEKGVPIQIVSEEELFQHLA